MRHAPTIRNLSEDEFHLNHRLTHSTARKAAHTHCGAVTHAVWNAPDGKNDPIPKKCINVAFGN